jgi:hypothetical protein
MQEDVLGVGPKYRGCDGKSVDWYECAKEKSVDKVVVMMREKLMGVFSLLTIRDFPTYTHLPPKDFPRGQRTFIHPHDQQTAFTHTGQGSQQILFP